MKRFVSLAIGILLGATVSIAGARTLIVQGGLSENEQLNNWLVISEKLLNSTSTFPSSGQVQKNEVLNAGTASSYASNAFFGLFDDFIQQTIVEADGPWIENSGAAGTDAAINAQEFGVVRLVTGTNSGGDIDGISGTTNASQLISHIPMQVDSTGLVFETRLHVNTAVTQTMVMVGFTDVTTIENPFEIGANDTNTLTATDAVMFVYDTRADTDEWFAMGVDSGTGATNTGTTSTAPAADTFQVLRIEVDGGRAKFYVDGKLKRTLRASVSPSTNIYATVFANGVTTSAQSIAARQVDIDYIFAGHARP